MQWYAMHTTLSKKFGTSVVGDLQFLIHLHPIGTMLGKLKWSNSANAFKQFSQQNPSEKVWLI